MGQALLNLGQAAPAANTPTSLYTVPAATSAVVSSLVICNNSSSADTFTVWHSLAGASHITAQNLYYQVTIPGNNVFTATLGICMATTDVLNVESGSGNLSFNLYGAQNT